MGMGRGEEGEKKKRRRGGKEVYWTFPSTEKEP